MTAPAYEVEVRPSFAPVCRVQVEDVAPETQEQLAALRLDELPETVDRFGCDGTSWILQVRTGAGLRTLRRWEPLPGRFRTACLLLLRQARIAAEAPLTVAESWTAERTRELFARSEIPLGPSPRIQAALGPALAGMRAILDELSRVDPKRLPLLQAPDPRECRDRLALYQRLRGDPALLAELLAPVELDGLTRYVFGNYADRANRAEGELMFDLRQLSDATTLRGRARLFGRLRRRFPGLKLASVAQRVARAILDRGGDALVLNRCPACQELTTLPTSTRCEACGHDWTERPPSALRIEACPNEADPLREWGGEVRCWTCGWPRKAHCTTCPACQAALPVGADLQPACPSCAWPYEAGS